jgi:hypothetical protein
MEIDTHISLVGIVICFSIIIQLTLSVHLSMWHPTQQHSWIGSIVACFLVVYGIYSKHMKPGNMKFSKHNT